MHPAHHDQVAVAVCGGLRQAQRVTGDVGHAVEDLRRLVAVGHDHRAALALERVDLVDPGQVVRDFQARSEEHTSELQSLMRNSYAVFCLKKKIYCLAVLEDMRRWQDAGNQTTLTELLTRLDKSRTCA